MSTLVFTDTADFGALQNASINAAVLPGRWNYSTDDTGTGLDDGTATEPENGSVSLDSGKLAVQSGTAGGGSLYLGDLSDTVLWLQDDATSGDFILEADVDLSSMTFTGVYNDSFPALVYRISDDTYATALLYNNTSGSSWEIYNQVFDGGSQVVCESTSYSGTPTKMRLTRSGDVWSVAMYFDSVGWQTTPTDSCALSTTGYLGVGNCYRYEQTTVLFDNMTVSTFSGTAEALVGDTGTGAARHFDAGAGNQFDWSTFSPSLSNATVTWDIETNNTGTFDNTSYTHTGLTTAQAQSISIPHRYAQVRANLTSTGANPSLDSLSVDAQDIPSLFTAREHCSVVSGAVKIGYHDFTTDDASTGLSEWTSVNAANADILDITTTAGSLTVAPDATDTRFSSGGAYSGPLQRLASGVSGDFEIVAKMHLIGSDSNYEEGAVNIRQDDYNYIRIIYGYANGPHHLEIRDYVSGATDDVLSTSGSDDTIYLKITRASNDFTLAYNHDGGASWTSVGTVSAAYDAALDIDLGAMTHATGCDYEVLYDYLDIRAGHNAGATALAGESGAGAARHIDAGAGNTLDWSTFAATLNNASATYDIKGNNTGTFDASSWDVTGYSLAQVQAYDPTSYRYWQIRVNLTATGADPSLDSLSVETKDGDITPPTDVTASINRILGSGDTVRAAVAWTNGTDIGGSGYAGATLELQIGGVYYVLKTDGTWAATSGTSASEREKIGSASSLEGEFVDVEDLASVGSATHARITSYDEAGNTNDLIVALTSDDLPAASDVRAGTSYDNGNLTGELDLPAEADVRYGVQYDSLTKTGELVASSEDPPSAPDLVLADGQDGQSVDLTVTADSGTTCTAYRKVSGSWAAATFEGGSAATWTADGSAEEKTIQAVEGWNLVKVKSSNGSMISESMDGVRVTDQAVTVARYQIVRIEKKPGAGEKTLYLEKIGRPINP